MSSLSVGNIAVEARRAVRLNSRAYGDRVLCMIDELIAEKKLSCGGLKEMLRVREIIGALFYEGASEYIESAINQIMGFAFMERSGVKYQ
ncbi:MAG: hypothetical protein FWF03_02825 [Defluviitaleaceae bacterium]|nr:hypothetical protein [Defluviitaleaceae bacterium]